MKNTGTFRLFLCSLCRPPRWTFIFSSSDVPPGCRWSKYYMAGCVTGEGSVGRYIFSPPKIRQQGDWSLAIMINTEMSHFSPGFVWIWLCTCCVGYITQPLTLNTYKLWVFVGFVRFLEVSSDFFRIGYRNLDWLPCCWFLGGDKPAILPWKFYFEWSISEAFRVEVDQGSSNLFHMSPNPAGFLSCYAIICFHLVSQVLSNLEYQVKTINDMAG